MPDPIGTNGQGTYDDGNIANQAITWLEGKRRKPIRFADREFCESARQGILLEWDRSRPL